MLLSIVVDPSAFNKECFLTPGYREHANQLFRAFRSNVVLLIDTEDRLKTALVERIQALPLGVGQSLQIQLAELLKQGNRRFIRCKSQDSHFPGSPNLLQIACRVSQRCNVDGLLVGDQSVDSLRRSGYEGSNAVFLNEYCFSEFESQRHRYMEELPPIDQLQDELDEIVSRPVRFTKWVRIYDKQIGSGNNTSHFRKGIEYILSQWQAKGYFASEPGGVVEIVTIEAESIRAGDAEHIRKQKRERNKICLEKIQDELVNRLRGRYPWDFKLLVKQDLDGIFHARHLQTQNAIVLFDRGFDLFKPDGSVKRNIVKVDNGSASHLSQCRSLQDAVT